MASAKPPDTDHYRKSSPLAGAIRERLSRDRIPHAVRSELVDILAGKFSAAGDGGSDIPTWLDTNINPAVEKLFRDLYDLCFHYAWKMVGDADTAQDIAQASMFGLLNCSQPVRNLKAWLRMTTHNQAVAYYRQRGRDKNLRDALVKNSLPIHADPDAEDLHRELDTSLIRKLLSPGDYRAYQTIKKSRSLHQYAQANAISYQTAKEHSLRIRHNLRAAYLRHCGYLDCQEIMSYQQVRYLKGFIRKLKTLCQPSAKPAIRDKRLRDAFGDSIGIMHWEVSRVDGDSFTVMVMVLTPTLPAAVRVTLKQNRSRHVSVAECFRLSLVATIAKGDTDALYKDKGKARLDKQKFLALAPQATVYDEEKFQQVLQSIRSDIERGK